jgi:hypothetical protein
MPKSPGARNINNRPFADGRSEVGSYTECEFSVNLPFLRVADLTPVLSEAIGQNETARGRAFQSWVREKFGAATKND